MKTSIHTSRKLEKLVKKLMQTEPNEDSGLLEKWKATVFYVHRRRYWLVTNAKTAYNVILEDIHAGNLQNIEDIFKEAFYKQLTIDGISVDFQELSTMIGELYFLPTDNDRRTGGFQVQRLYEMGLMERRYDGTEERKIALFAAYMNTNPIRLSKGPRYTLPTIEMKEALGSLSRDEKANG